MKQAFPNIVANRALCQRLRDELLSKTLSHAYIIEGAVGSGKHTLAFQIAAALACEKKDADGVPLPCGTCPSCRKILGGFSTDVIVKGREDKATLGVDVIRDVRTDVYIPPNDNEHKVYLIEDAHLMTQQAQNAFLLTLEEPPPYVVFLLLCQSASPLLETVRSRAATLRTEPVPTAEIDAHLCRVNPEASALKASDEKEYSEILAAANGCIGQAISLLDAKRRKPIITRRRTAREFVNLCAARKSSTATMRFLNGLPQKRDELSEQLSVTLVCLRDLLLCKQTEQAPLCFFADRDEACTLAYGFTTPALLSLCDRVSQALDQLQRNANVRLVITMLATQTGLLS